MSVDRDMNSTVPAAKSQPLHNFSLPYLNWTKIGESSSHNHTRRRSTELPLQKHTPLRDSTSVPSSQRQSPLRHSAASSTLESMDCLAKQSPVHGGESSKSSPVRELAKHAPTRGKSARNSPIRGESVRQFPKLGFASESEGLGRSKDGLVEYKRKHSRNSERAVEKLGKQVESDATGVKRSKLVIKFPCKNKPEEENTLEEGRLKIDSNKENIEADEVQEDGRMDNNDEETKKWNLRPRKPVGRSNRGGMKAIGAALPDKNKTPSPSRTVNIRSRESERSLGGGGGGEKKDNRKLSIWVALSKEEIEEDIFSMTGSKPSRRPRKRTKNIQKQIDLLNHGMWLVSISPDSYKVSENSMKG